MLSRIKLDYPQIRRTILEIDDAKLSVDDLKAIAKQLPTPDEVSSTSAYTTVSWFGSRSSQIERIKSFDDVSKLAKADQYFYQVQSFTPDIEIFL